MSRARALWRTPSHWLDRLALRVTDSDLRHERSLVVVGPEAQRGLFRRDMARSAVFLVAVVGASWLPDDNAWRVLATGTLGVVVGWHALALSQRASAYRRGWLAGRKRFVDQATHHERQGNTTREWVITECEHDAYHVLGARHASVSYGDEER